MTSPKQPPVDSPDKVLGIMAGSGSFPFLVARGARAQGFKVVVCGFHDNADPALGDEADAFTLLHLGQFGKLIDFFKQHGVRQVCMAGAINKPKAWSVKPDFRAARILLRLIRHKGDDAILRAVTKELEGEGFVVVRPDSMAPSLRGPEGVLGKVRPTEAIWRDIRFGWDIAKALGSLDVGQCVVVQNGVVIAIEAVEGTDAAVSRAGELVGEDCVAVKIIKPGQDERLDMPSLGSVTLENLARHKYAALAFEAGKTLFFDREEALRIANASGIAVVGVPEDAGGFFASHIKNKF